MPVHPPAPTALPGERLHDWDGLATRTGQLLAGLPQDRQDAFLRAYGRWLDAVGTDPKRLDLFEWLSALPLESMVNGAKGRERDTVAIHEAGHAVTAYVEGLSLRSVSIAPTAEDHMPSLGHIEIEAADLMRGDQSVNDALRWCTMNMAGPLAEELSDYPETPGVRATHHAETLSAAQCVGPWGGTDEALALVTLAERRARGILLRYWPVVQAVAGLLRDRTTVTGEVAEALIRVEIDARGLSHPARKAVAS